MANSSPPWVRQVQVVVNVENIPILPEAATEYAIDSYGTLSTSSSTYQTLKEWEVTANRIGILRAIELSCDNYAVAQFKLVVAGTTVFEDKKLPESFTKDWPDLQLTAGQKCTVSVKSNGTTTINAYCDINGKEVG